MTAALSLGRDITDEARANRLDLVVGREREMDELLRVLCRRTKSNPLILGEPGVGKTALVEGLAQLLIGGAVPLALRGRRLLELPLGSLLAGTQYRGDLEKRVEDFIEEARSGRCLVFIDEIHLLVLAGRGSGMDAANLLKPVLARGEVPCIGATTEAEAQEMFRLDPALERRFQSIKLEEPSLATVGAILRAVRPRLETHHGIKISDAALDAALVASSLQKGLRRNPDRALDILEDACAREQLRISREVKWSDADLAEFLDLEKELLSAKESLDLERHVKARSARDAHLACCLGSDCDVQPVYELTEQHFSTLPKSEGNALL